MAVRLESRLDGELTVSECAGAMFRKSNAVYIQYVETDDSRGASRVTVKWDGTRLRILRHGDVSAEQSFQAGQRLAGFYDAPPLRFRIETETEALRAPAPGEAALPLELAWRYGMWMNEEWVGRFDLTLRIREET